MRDRQGSRTWFFPDGDIPAPGDAAPHGHESLLMLNPNDADAEVLITVYFEDRDPAVLAPQVVGARRVRCIRTNEPIDGYQIPLGQYALKLESSVPLICQIGRLDVQQPNLAYYTVMGHPAD
ncbi:MAG: sensory rhodopsin transducer [Chloroflexota bacterium]|nr:sensory rhodopsin transducer [Chloroflexota bacterium]